MSSNSYRPLRKVLELAQYGAYTIKAVRKLLSKSEKATLKRQVKLGRVGAKSYLLTAEGRRALAALR